MKRFLRIIPIVALVAALPFIIAACGDDDDDTNGTTPTETMDDDMEGEESPTTDNGDMDEGDDEENGMDDGDASPTMEDGAGEDGMNGEDEASIVATAEATGDFTNLIAAIDAAGLTSTLEGEGPYTVFAPNDAAFEALPEGELDDLLEDEEALTNLLQYHVVEGEVTSDMLEDGQEVEMLNGDTLTVSIEGETVMIGDATVSTADVEAGNGVIHIIDTVLVPAE